MAVYLSRGALRLPAVRLLANSRLCVNLAFEIWLLLGVNVATTNNIILTDLQKTYYITSPQAHNWTKGCSPGRGK